MNFELGLNSLAVDLRKGWEVGTCGSLDIFSLVLSKFSNLSIFIHTLNRPFGRDQSAGKYNPDGQPMYTSLEAFKEKLEGKYGTEEIISLFNYLSKL